MVSIISPRLFALLPGFYPDTVDIQQATETRDSAGQPIKTWATFTGHGSLSARVSPSGGGENKTASQVWSRATHVIELAGNYPTITTKMRAYRPSDGLVFDILLVESDGQEASTRLVCEVIT